MHITKKAAVALLVSASLVAGGCTTIDPYPREEKTAKATTGAAR